MPSRPPTESDPRAGESDEPEDKVTKGNFEVLARGLFAVTPEAYAAEEARQKAEKTPPSRKASADRD